jgi:HK97 family phage portal protein
MLQWLKRLFSSFDKRSLSVQDLKNLVYGPPTLAGVAVSEEMALGLAAIWCAVNLIASNIASLDADVFMTVPQRGKRIQRYHPVASLLANPNDTINKFKFWRTYIMHVVCAGNAFAEIERAQSEDRRFDGMAVALHLVHWRNVRILQEYAGGPIKYHLIHEDKVLDPSDVLHTTALSWDGIIGMSPIRAMRESIGITMAQERYSGGVYGNGAVPRGVLRVNQVEKVGGVVGLSPETKANIREAWNAIYGGPESSGKIGILPPGTEWVETNMSPADAELLLSRTFQIEEVSRIFGVPTNLLFSGNQQSYNSNEENNTQFYQLGLRPILENLESEIDTKLIPHEDRLRGVFVKFNVKDLNKGNYTKTVEAESRAVLTGMKTPNEAREALGLNPMEGFDDLLIPTNMTIVSDVEGKQSVSGSLDKSGTTDQLSLPAPDADQGVQETALNGAQIASLLELVQTVANGGIPVDTAKGMIAASFPTLTSEEIDKILEPLNSFKPQASADALQDSVREAFVNEVARAHRRHQKAPTKDQRAYLVEALGPSYRAYAAAHGIALSVTEYAERWHSIDPTTSSTEDYIALAR